MRPIRARTLHGCSLGLAAALAGAPGARAAEPAHDAVAPVTVIGATPMPGAKIDMAKAPYEVRSLSAADLALSGIADATGALAAQVGGINIDENLDDPFQPDILYRGFEASPVLGTPQGLAVYQNGVRVNEAFGDTVNWDLIPDDAVARIDVVGTNPVYGLNALGGAVVVTMKNGFQDPGGDAELSGGAFGQRQLGLSWGAHAEHLGVFVAARGLDQNGWRELSADRVRQLYGVVSARSERLDLDLGYTGADNVLHGESASPVQELAVSRRLIFTSPQVNANALNFVTLNGTLRATSTLSFQGDVYVRDYRQQVANGNTTDYSACAAPALAGRLCQADGATPLASTSGGTIADLSQGGATPIGENDRESLHTRSFGGALQATSSASLLGFGNQLSVGAEADKASIDYGATVEVGVIDSALVVQPSGLFVSTPEGVGFTATPVGLRADNTYAGAFITDTLDLTERLSVTASGRYNRVKIALHDRLGDALSGTNAYARFNPAIGATYRIANGLTAYLGYAEGSRAPTASEIECSDPVSPCLLPSSLSADPPDLKQVVSHTYEVGLRGERPAGRGRMNYSLGLYRTVVRDDIYAVATSLSAGYFQNIAGTRRQGGELAATYRDDRLAAYLSYAYVDATFDADLLLPSPSNPFQDADGDIHVRPGDHLPGIPRSRLKLGADVAVARRLRLGGDLQVLSGQSYRGDEANQLAQLPGYAVVGLHARYQVAPHVQVFAKVVNAFDARYATFGLLGDPAGVGAPGVPAGDATHGPGVDSRFQSPASPFAAYGGVRFSF